MSNPRIWVWGLTDIYWAHVLRSGTVVKFRRVLAPEASLTMTLKGLWLSLLCGNSLWLLYQGREKGKAEAGLYGFQWCARQAGLYVKALIREHGGTPRA